MLELNNLVLDTDVHTIVETLRSSVKDKLLCVKDTGGDNIMVSCPVHKNGQERRPSCGIHKRTGVCHCFTCGFTSTLQEFISVVLGVEDYGVAGSNWLLDNFDRYEIEDRDFELDLARKELPHKQYSYVPDIVLDQYRYTHPYMYKRKLTDEVIDLFDIGYDKETDCITFPVRDKNGNCLFVARRSVKGKYFNYPSGAEKPLYGLYELIKTYDAIPTEVWVTESMINCLTLWTHGIPAVALNGTGSKEQIEFLNSLPIRSIVLSLDPDVAGRSGTEKIRKACMNGGHIISTVDYVDSRDINDLSSDELMSLIETKHFI